MCLLLCPKCISSHMGRPSWTNRSCVVSQSPGLCCFFSYSRTDQDIQTYTIAVINALFLKAPEEKRQVRLHFLTALHITVSFTCYLRVVWSAFLCCNCSFCAFFSQRIKKNKIKGYRTYNPKAPPSQLFLSISLCRNVTVCSFLLFSLTLSLSKLCQALPCSPSQDPLHQRYRVRRCAATLIMNDSNPQFWFFFPIQHKKLKTHCATAWSTPRCCVASYTAATFANFGNLRVVRSI